MRNGFSLIEVLIVVALIGILSSSTALAINPTKRIAQARDAQRKTSIGQMANALIAYETQFQQFPEEDGCDSSIGSANGPCPPPPPKILPSWDQASLFYQALTGQGFIKSLPIDPINNTTYYYRYEPRKTNEDPCKGTGLVCRYWIGARLESPQDPAKPVFRCSDNELLTAGVGCLEVDNFYN